MTGKKPPNNPIEAYRRTDVVTANRETILLMMYAALLRVLNAAIEANAQGNVAEKSRKIVKAQEIVNELRSTLNFEIGGEIAISLERLYSFVTRLLLEANQNKEGRSLRDALDIITTLNSAWESAVEKLKEDQSGIP